MTTMQHEAKETTSRTMYIRGIPFECPGSAKDKAQEAVAVPVAQPCKDAAPRESAAASSKTTAKADVTTPAFSIPNLLARFGTACGRRAGISRAETEAQTRLVKSRRSVRVFSEETVPMRTLRELIATAARGLADGKPGSPRFVVVEATTTMDDVTRLAARWLRQEGILADGVGPDADARKIVFGGAPHLAVAHGKTGSREAADACALAMARLEWAGAAMGLGTCFAGEIVRAAADSSALAAALSIPTGHTAYAAAFLGHPGFAAGQPETAPGVRIIWL